ncbi:MAG: CHAT domain-containing protein, partial [Ignavibacteriales bacterium]|nr:CHAT domain-containing protein [Ignavibacteriales bacterium]
PETGAYLVDELETAIVSNTKSIVERRQPATVERRAVLVGYPDYDFAGGGGGEQGATGGTERALDGETRSSLRGVNLAPLEGTKAETAAIEELMRANGWEARALLGAVATETAVKSVDRPRALHIATHGFFVKDVERTTEDDVFGVEKAAAAERPLLRSGLFFAGAAAALNSEATFPTNDNGVLTAYEAMNMNLDGAELVALSACETGLGDVKNGEGVYGLQRAFQTAGAQSVLMSLWKVDDDATRLLMTEFYRRWLGGASKREALDAARTATRERYPEPLHWGAFTLVGG